MNIKSDDYRISKHLNETNTSYVYGEIDPKCMVEILNTLPNINSMHYSFVDIGSGCGRLCYQLSIHFDFIVYGVEIDIDRFITSIKQTSDTLEFICESFQNLYFGNYDILYCCNIVFSDDDNHRLYNKITKEFRGICFLFDYDKNMLPFYVQTYTINTSWMKNVFLHMFIVE